MRVIEPGHDEYTARCAECGCRFVYGREDVKTNYGVGGGREVACPHCGHAFHHLGYLKTEPR